MANSDKNILVTPNTNSSDKPKVEYVGFDNNPVSLEIKDDSTLMWRTATDILFSVTPTTGNFSYEFFGNNSMPSLRGTSTGDVQLNPYSGATSVGPDGSGIITNILGQSRIHIGLPKSGIENAANFNGVGAARLTIKGASGSNYNAITITTTLANNTAKGGVLSGMHYTSDSYKPFVGFATWSDQNENYLYMGGGGWGMPDATNLRFYTAPNQTTDNAGVLRWLMNRDGHFYPNADRTYDIGTSGNRVREIYSDGITFNYNTNSGNTGGANSIQGSDRYVSRNTAMSYGTNMYGQWPQKHLGRFELRGYTAGGQAGGRYLHVKLNQPMSSNMMFWRAEGYLYNRGNIWARAGCYPYAPSNSILSLYINNSGNSTISTMYRASDGYLVIRFDRNSTGYSEGRFDLWLSGHGNGSYAGKDVTGIGYSDSTSFF